MKKSGGWSLTELLIGLAVFAIVMAGIYQYFVGATRLSQDTIKQNVFERNVRSLKALLERRVKNLGFNPLLTPYDIFSNCDNPPSPFSANRIGLAAAEPHRMLFTSDDNILFKPDPTNADGWTGSIQPSEKYGFWVASDAHSPAINFSHLTNSDGELCDPLTEGSFTETYSLFQRVKNGDSPNYLTESTVASALANNVACFEVRYYAPSPIGSADAWTRVWDGSTEEEMVYRIPSTFDCLDPDVDTGFPNYFRYVRDSIRLIRMGLVLVAPRSETDEIARTNRFTGDGRKATRVIVETRLGNVPWMSNTLMSSDGTSVCMPTGNCSP